MRLVVIIELKVILRTLNLKFKDLHTIGKQLGKLQLPIFSLGLKYTLHDNSIVLREKLIYV